MTAEATLLHSITRQNFVYALECHSSGPDNTLPLFFKKVKYSISKPLALLFNQFLSVGFVPEAWKNAIITPVYKMAQPKCQRTIAPYDLPCAASLAGIQPVRPRAQRTSP